MKTLTPFLFFLLFTEMVSFGQTGKVIGKVSHVEDSTLIAGATVSLLLQKDSSVVGNTVSNTRGEFEFIHLNPNAYVIRVVMIGYQQYVTAVTINNNEVGVGNLLLYQQGKDLGVVTIIAKAPAVVQKEDTTQYSENQYQVNPDATTEDLIKKMPGIVVDKNGTVTAQGEQVKKVTVDGKDFFGEDASAAIKNIPAEVVDKIQVFDKLSDQAQLTGIDDGNSQKSINIVTKSGIKNAQFGRIYAGYGTDERYTGGGNVSFFKDNRRISIVGNFNNINQQNFGSQDLLGVSNNSNNNSRSYGSSRGYNSGSSESFTVNQANGISITNAAGINYTDKWGLKTTVSGSYFFNNSNNSNLSESATQLIDDNQNSFQNSDAESKNYNNRINARIEYKADSMNTFYLIPSLNFQKNNASNSTGTKSYDDFSDSIYNAALSNSNNKNGYNLKNSLLYRHSFHKKGRSVSLGLNIGFSKNDGKNTTDGMYRFYDESGMPVVPDSLQNQNSHTATNGKSWGGTFTYNEPLGVKSQLQIEYNPSVQNNKSNQETYLLDGQLYTVFDTSLSNKFDNKIATNNAGITYRYTLNKDDQLTFGTSFQESKLTSDRIFPSATKVNQSFFNFLPNAYWRKKTGKYSNMRFFYRATTIFPTINQLQDVYNLNNPLRVTTGNPELTQSFTHYLGGRYTFANTKTNRNFFASIYFQTARDFISNASYKATADSTIQKDIILKRGTQLIKPVNLDGYRNIRSAFSYGAPIKLIKTTVNFNAGLTYSRLPGLINYVPAITNNYIINTGVAFVSNISEYIDFNLSYNMNINNAETRGGKISNNKYVNHTTGILFNLLNKKGWFLQNDLSNQINVGLSGGLDQNFTLWNAAIGKKLLPNKSIELRLSVFDILHENQSVYRTVNNTYIEDSKSTVLQRYFMFTFTYSLKNYGKPKTKPNEEERSDHGNYNRF